MILRKVLYHQTHLVWIGWWPRLVFMDRWPTESDWVARSGRWIAFRHTAEEALTKIKRMIKGKGYNRER